MTQEESFPRWAAGVPKPELGIVCEDDGRYRAEIVNYIKKGERVKDIRVRGPARVTRKEAKKDAAELRRAALKSGGADPALFHVRARRKELESIQWTEKDLTGPDVVDKNEVREKEEAERRTKLDELERLEKERKKQEGEIDVLARLEAAKDASSQEHGTPVGPNWKRPGSLTQLPVIQGHPGDSWFMHEKQDASGKHKPWLFFNSASGKYYQQRDGGEGYIQIGVPNAPREHTISIRLGSANMPSKAGKKLDMAVLLPELHKTGFLLKRPLEFLDKPASLFLLCDGLRNAAQAADFCARKLHTLVLPKLSARSSEWEDFELVDLLRDAVEALDVLLLNSPARFAGCNLAVGLLVGTRLVLGALGDVRCVVCRPPAAAAAATLRAALAGATAARPWTSQLVAGGEAHTGACEEERLRLQSVGNRLPQAPGAPLALSAVSVRPAALAAVTQERDRMLKQIAGAANPFAALGLAPADLKEGAASIRKVFRRRSLVVHPDKVGEGLKEIARAAFAKLESATTAVEQMLQIDAQAAGLLASVDAAQDTGQLGADPAVAAKLLGVQEGCEAQVAKKASQEKFHKPLSRLQQACPKDVDRALRTLEVAEESVVRGTVLWTPPVTDEAVHVTRALGCKDLKVPVPLLSAGLAAECIDLEPGTCIGFALLSDGMHAVGGEDVARELARHSPARPRAAALRLALAGTAKNAGMAAGVICGYLESEPAAAAAQAPKRARTCKPERVRISHILLRWAGMKGEDEFGRPGLTPPSRTQPQAEAELLELLEELLAADPKTLGARFKAQVVKRSECASALTVPYADLGWIDQGGAELPLEAAAFATAVGGLSDVVVSSRGAHLMYRMA